MNLESIPSRIIFILPCCIGDVVLATATLQALRRAYPQAHITWAVGSWSKGVIANHPLLDSVLDTGPAALPVKSVGGFVRFVNQLRAGRFDLAVSLVRSPLMSLAALLSGIPRRAGLDSGGRGFGYTIRAQINPRERRHEAEIYLDVARALGLDVGDCWANMPLHDTDLRRVQAVLEPPPPISDEGEPPAGFWGVDWGTRSRLIVIHPGGGRNPGMVMDNKRWPPENFAALANRLAARLEAQVVVVGGPDDAPLVTAVTDHLQSPFRALAGQLSFGELATLASLSLVYIGNDTGLTHLAAATGASTVMILGPSDPARYAPFTPNSLALWKPYALDARGVWGGAPKDWDWARDGIGVDEAEQRILAYLANIEG
jgi:heptosyltransferase-2/heptosyltransferase-3